MSAEMRVPHVLKVITQRHRARQCCLTYPCVAAVCVNQRRFSDTDDILVSLQHGVRSWHPVANDSFGMVGVGLLSQSALAAR